MIFANFTAWTLLLWIAALLLIMVPIVGIMGKVLCDGYFRAKDAHIARIAAALGKTLEKIEKSNVLDLLKKNGGK